MFNESGMLTVWVQRSHQQSIHSAAFTSPSGPPLAPPFWGHGERARAVFALFGAGFGGVALLGASVRGWSETVRTSDPPMRGLSPLALPSPIQYNPGLCSGTHPAPQCVGVLVVFAGGWLPCSSKRFPAKFHGWVRSCAGVAHSFWCWCPPPPPPLGEHQRTPLGVPPSPPYHTTS